ncbi:ATP-binding cassette domain-containing protein [Myxococcota bacterium]|nr:ATP-binding cassette domain-containing protein [Myxococcota bacterium]MBU1430174.1 ATP-binding cassette domain-containing protein [Myxococcota bacterium]MBU1900067.1 ATP-binding cassette domain-containing protein [Myxococcota bacterium]
MIRFIDVYKRFGAREILKGVSLDVDEGQILFIIGKSGAGKSVLIKHLVGLLRPDAGRIIFEGQDITRFKERDFYPLRKRCGMVFQHSTLFDSMTLIENVALPIRKHQGLSQRESLAQAAGYLEAVGMEQMASARVTDIGDGLRKRVAIARALTLSPRYMIFDEPTTALDPLSALRIDRLIRQLSDERGVTSIVISHDLRSVFSVADRVVMLYQGRVQLDGAPEDFRRSVDPIIHQFVNGLPDGPMEL